jgi:hypothetical protein
MKNKSDSLGILVELPADIAYLAEPALKFRLTTEWDSSARLGQLTNVEMQQLAALAETVRTQNDYWTVLSFLNEHPIIDYDESAYLYFLFLMMDEAGLSFDTKDSHNNNPPMDSILRADGWLRCPNCGWKFTINDPFAWNGRMHSKCGQRLNVKASDMEPNQELDSSS